MNWKFIRSTAVLVVMCLAAAISHEVAHREQIFELTILGFLSAVMGGMYYGLSVPCREVKE